MAEKKARSVLGDPGWLNREVFHASHA